jgi:hypothetical protein
MNKQDENTLVEVWQSDTNWLNDKIDEFFKNAQDQAYALGLKRGINIVDLSDEEIMEIASNFGEFQYGDAQGHKRRDFARAIMAASRDKQGA